MRGWGPSHQQARKPRDPRWLVAAMSVGMLVVLGERASGHLSTLRLLIGAAAVWVAARIVRAAFGELTRCPELPERVCDRIARAPDPGQAAREECLRRGGGAFLGFAPVGRWVTADPEHAVLALGPPRGSVRRSV